MFFDYHHVPLSCALSFMSSIYNLLLSAFTVQKKTGSCLENHTINHCKWGMITAIKATRNNTLAKTFFKLHTYFS